jgi:hypothetical protein
MTRARRQAPRAARVLLAAGVLALGYVAYVVADTKMYQAIEQRRFENLRGVAAASPEPIVGGVIGVMLLRAAVPSGRR